MYRFPDVRKLLKVGSMGSHWALSTLIISSFLLKGVQTSAEMLQWSRSYKHS